MGIRLYLDIGEEFQLLHLEYDLDFLCLGLGR